MAELTEDVKVFIVQRLAMFGTPTQVADAVKEEFDLEVSRQQVNVYRAGRAGQQPAEKWVELFKATRAEFLKRVSDQPAANKAVRVTRLERLALRAEEVAENALKANPPKLALAGDYMDRAAAIYEQIAKEVGRVFTNKATNTLKGDKDAPLVFELDTGGKPNRDGAPDKGPRVDIDADDEEGE